MAEAVPQKIRRIPSSDLRNLVHYNKERPRSTPKKDIRVETTPLLGEVKEYVKIII